MRAPFCIHCHSLNLTAKFQSLFMRYIRMINRIQLCPASFGGRHSSSCSDTLSKGTKANGGPRTSAAHVYDWLGVLWRPRSRGQSMRHNYDNTVRGSDVWWSSNMWSNLYAVIWPLLYRSQLMFRYKVCSSMVSYYFYKTVDHISDYYYLYILRFPLYLIKPSLINFDC